MIQRLLGLWFWTILLNGGVDNNVKPKFLLFKLFCCSPLSQFALKLISQSHRFQPKRKYEPRSTLTAWFAYFSYFVHQNYVSWEDEQAFPINISWRTFQTIMEIKSLLCYSRSAYAWYSFSSVWNGFHSIIELPSRFLLIRADIVQVTFVDLK